MDEQLLRTVSRLQAVRRKSVGIQQQIYGQPASAPRRLVRDATRPFPDWLQELLAGGHPVSVHRNSPGPRSERELKGHPMQVAWNLESELADMPATHRLSTSTFARDVIEGLSKTPKSISSKHFYDARGSRLFQRITGLPEYYLTRCEVEILETHSQRIAAEFGAAPLRLIELGVGDGHKTAVILRQLLEGE